MVCVYGRRPTMFCKVDDTSPSAWPSLTRTSHYPPILKTLGFCFCCRGLFLAQHFACRLFPQPPGVGPGRGQDEGARRGDRGRLEQELRLDR